MAFTLEATLVVPLTMAITVGLISASINFYGTIENDAVLESESFIYARDNKELWSCKVRDNSIEYDNNRVNIDNRNIVGDLGWSKMIAINPIKEKMIMSYAFDTFNAIEGYIPLLKEMEGLFFENKK